MPCAAQASQEAPLTDDIDRAQAREAEMLADALGERLRRAQRVRRWVRPGLPSAVFCGEEVSGPWGCGDPIDEARRAAVPGCQLCVRCQAMAEKQGLR
jgi:phage/conjugal plasmid C-4 type zinc finger TraR family protein